MDLGDDGRPQPTGEFETLQADAVVLALGQEADSGFLRRVPGIDFKADGTVIVGPDMMTGAARHLRRRRHGAGERTVTVATGHGKKAARHIDAWLRGTSDERPPKHPVVDFAMLNLPIFSDADPSPQQRPAGRRRAARASPRSSPA